MATTTEKIDALFDRTSALCQSGRLSEAEALHAERLSRDPGATYSLAFLAGLNVVRGDPDTAERLSQQCLAQDPSPLKYFLKIGLVFEQLAEPGRAAEAFAQAIGQDRTNYVGYLYLGTLFEDGGDPEKAARLYGLAVEAGLVLPQAGSDPALPSFVRRKVMRAAALLSRHVANLHRAAAVQALDDPARADDLRRVLSGLWCRYQTEPIDYGDDPRRPGAFFLPGLPATPFVDRARFDWIDRLEAALGDIRDEALNAIDLDRDGRADVPAHASPRPTGQQPEAPHDWSSVPLFTTGGQHTDIAARLPRTMAAVQAVADTGAMVTRSGVPAQVYFSALKPSTRIPPHAGRTNAALTLHLPIVALDGCGLRVGGQDHPWRDGEAVVFDDSFQHQAWNDSDTVRLLLVFQVWHPDLTAIERRALDASFGALDEWTDSLYGALTIDL